MPSKSVILKESSELPTQKILLEFFEFYRMTVVSWIAFFK